MTTPIAPGWYDDPEAPHQLRYYDGVLWTAHTTPRSTRAAQPPAATPAAGAGPGSTPPAAGAAPTTDPYGWRGGQDPGVQQGPPQWGAPNPQWGQQPWSEQAPGQVPGQLPGQEQGTGWGPAGGRQLGPSTPDGTPLAGYWQRVGAFILDGLICGILTGILGGYFLLRALRPWLDEFTTALNSSNDPATFEQLTNNLSSYLSGRDFVTFSVIGVLVGLLYHVGFLSRFGATPGKMALRISVRERERPGPLPLPVALRRYALTLAIAVVGLVPGIWSGLASAVRIVDLLFPAFDARRQALHDKIAGTQVVQGSQPRGRRSSQGPVGP